MVIGLVAVLVIGAAAVWWLSQPPPIQPGKSAAIAGWDHINPPDKGKNYNSVPPTSGDHYPNPADTRVYGAPVADEVQIHNLEHGQIIIQYTCTDCPDLAEKLKPFVQRYNPWVLVAPYPDQRVGAKIVLTAWGRIDTFDEFDEARIVRFIDAYKNRGRENVMSSQGLGGRG